MQLLIVDHKDSFTYNLVDCFRRVGNVVSVVWPDKIPASIMGYDALILSPGPGRPSDYPQTLELIQTLPPTLPVLGVCLGMQLLNEWSGGTTIHAPTLMHGKTCPISHAGRGVFSKLPSPCTVMRYHSLACKITSPDWEVCAWSADDTPMAMQHRVHPWVGLQFHPESFMTPEGLAMLQNWMHP